MWEQICASGNIDLLNIPVMTKKYCFALDLKDDPALIERYEAHHAPGQVWPEITESIKAAGITGNRWLTAPASGGFGAVHYGTWPEVLQSQLVVDPNDGSDLISTEYTESGAPYFDPKPGDTYLCASEFSGCPPPIPPGFPNEISETDQSIAGGTLAFGAYDGAQNWTGSRHLYEYIKANPGLEQSEQLVQDFLDSVVNTSIGAFYEIDRDMDGLFTLDSLTQAQLDSNRAGIDETMEQIISIDSLLREGVPSQDSAQLAEQRDSLSHQLDSLMQETDALMQTIADTRELEIANILADNAAVVTPTLFEDNQKAVNDIFLRTIARGQSDFSQTDLDTLRAIANQCFICGGDAVFLARSLYAKTDSVLVYDDDNLCGSVSQPLMKQKDNNPVQASFTLIPNPAADWLIVEILNENPFNGDMRIFDVSGKEVLAVPLNLEKVSSVPVDISMLHAGMYVCNFYQNGRPVQTERLSVIK